MSSPRVVVGMRLPGETSDVTDVTVVDSVAPTGLLSAPPVVVGMRLLGDTSEVTDVTAVASVAPTAKNNTFLYPHKIYNLIYYKKNKKVIRMAVVNKSV